MQMISLSYLSYFNAVLKKIEFHCFDDMPILIEIFHMWKYDSCTSYNFKSSL